VKIPLHILPDPYSLNVWGCTEQLTKDDVTKALQVGLTKILPLLDFEDHTNVDLHASRIAYFVVYGWKDLVEVDIQFTPDKEPYIWTTDGVHRVSAAIYVEQEEIGCLYNEVVEQFIRERLIYS
jgi:hypothetical protein